MSFQSILHINEFRNQKAKNSKSNMSKLSFTYSSLHLSRDKMENNIKTKNCKMDFANSLPYNHRHQMTHCTCS